MISAVLGEVWLSAGTVVGLSIYGIQRKQLLVNSPALSETSIAKGATCVTPFGICFCAQVDMTLKPLV
jgi:hypothetical protein